MMISIKSFQELVMFAVIGCAGYKKIHTFCYLKPKLTMSVWIKLLFSLVLICATSKFQDSVVEAKLKIDLIDNSAVSGTVSEDSQDFFAWNDLRRLTGGKSKGSKSKSSLELSYNYSKGLKGKSKGRKVRNLSEAPNKDFFASNKERQIKGGKSKGWLYGSYQHTNGSNKGKSKGRNLSEESNKDFFAWNNERRIKGGKSKGVKDKSWLRSSYHYSKSSKGKKKVGKGSKKWKN